MQKLMDYFHDYRRNSYQRLNIKWPLILVSLIPNFLRFLPCVIQSNPEHEMYARLGMFPLVIFRFEFL